MPDLKTIPIIHSEISQTVKIAIHKVSYTDFHKHYGNIEKLLEIALPLTMVVTRDNLALDSIRPTVEKCVRVRLIRSTSFSHTLYKRSISFLTALLDYPVFVGCEYSMIELICLLMELNNGYFIKENSNFNMQLVKFAEWLIHLLEIYIYVVHRMRRI